MQFYSALVSGANRGLGLQFIVELAKNTTHLIATCRDPSKSTELNQLASKHPNIHILQLDVTDYSRYASFVQEVDKIVGEKGLQLSIQNAGLMLVGNIDQTTPEMLREIYEVNAIAPILLTRQLIPLLKKSVAAGQRTIASFLSSLLGSVELNIDNRFISYRMSKSALNQGVRTLANAYKNDSIEFVILHPGHVQTDMGSLVSNPPVTPEESVQGMLKHLQNTQLTKDGRVISWTGSFLPW